MPSFVAIGNHLWQSTIFVAIVAAACTALGHHSARTRYRLWVAASMKFLVPFSWLVSAGPNIDVAAKPDLPPVAIEWVAASLEPATVAGPAPPADNSWYVVAIAAAWAMGALLLLFRWVTRWRTLQQAARSARPLPLVGPIPVLLSESTVEPGVFGIVRPVMLLPAGIAGKLTPEQLDAVIAHESCHIRHRDNLTAALHMVVEVAFWFYPVVWWVGARLVRERERACDEAVVAQGSRPHVYAQGILNVSRFFLESPLKSVPGVTGSTLKERVDRILSERVVRRLTTPAKAGLAALAVCALAGPVVVGMLHGQRAPIAPDAFEVATVRPADPAARGVVIEYQPGGGLRVVNVPLRMLIAFAYGVSNFQLTGGPGWIDSQRFDVQAKSPEGPSASDPKNVRLRLQALLRERFGLALQAEAKETQGYALVVAKGGHKLKQSTAGDGISARPGLWHGRNVDVKTLAENLSGYLRRPVVDNSGLTGTWEFRLEWTPEDAGPLGRLKDPEQAAPPNASGPSIFTAIQEQPGLQLQSQKVQAEHLVVVRVEHPSEN